MIRRTIRFLGGGHGHGHHHHEQREMKLPYKPEWEAQKKSEELRTKNYHAGREGQGGETRQNTLAIAAYLGLAGIWFVYKMIVNWPQTERLPHDPKYRKHDGHAHH